MAKKDAVEEYTDEDINDGEPVRLLGLDAHVMASSGHGGPLPVGNAYNWGEWVKTDSSPITNPKLSKEELHELNLNQHWEIEVGVVNENKGRVMKFSHKVSRLPNGHPQIQGDIGVSPINVRAINHYKRTQGRVLTIQFAKEMEDDRRWYVEATPVIDDVRGTSVYFEVD